MDSATARNEILRLMESAIDSTPDSPLVEWGNFEANNGPAFHLRAADGTRFVVLVEYDEQQEGRYLATFNPQAWVNDQAIDVDPQGETEWDCTEFVTPDVLAYLIKQGKLTGDTLDGGEVLDGDDVFKHDPASPEWIRDWTGPFSIHVRRED